MKTGDGSGAQASLLEKKRRVLEIGSGPVPISMISASRWCEWIVCSDFLEQNRQKIKQWLAIASPPGHHDETWLPFFRYVAQLERAEYFSFLYYSFTSYFQFPLSLSLSTLFIVLWTSHIWNFFSKHIKIIIVNKVLFYCLGLFKNEKKNFLLHSRNFISRDRRRCCWTESVDPSELSYRVTSCWLTRWWITKTPTDIHRTTWLSVLFVLNSLHYRPKSTRLLSAMLPVFFARLDISSFR